MMKEIESFTGRLRKIWCMDPSIFSPRAPQSGDSEGMERRLDNSHNHGACCVYFCLASNSVVETARVPRRTSFQASHPGVLASKRTAFRFDQALRIILFNLLALSINKTYRTNNFTLRAPHASLSIFCRKCLHGSIWYISSAEVELVDWFE